MLYLVVRTNWNWDLIWPVGIYSSPSAAEARAHDGNRFSPLTEHFTVIPLETDLKG